MTGFDVQVRGAGIVGQSLALALARLGLQVALRREPARAAGSEDVRAYALNAASVALLRGLKVWEALPTQAVTAVHDMLVQGDDAGATLAFSAWEQGVGALAWITDAAALERELAAAIRFAPHVSVIDADALDIDAPLTAWCDGKASVGREALGVRFERREHGQRAIAARLTSARAHQGVARQWFRSPDVLALLPFDSPEPQRSHALVWSLPTAQAESLLALDDAGFAQAVTHATEGALGELKLASARQSWPLMQARASAWSGTGWVLLGDAAHVVHPLAGQGLNLGLADVAALAEVIAERETWRSLGDAKLLRRYDRERLAPTWAMDHVTDGLLQLFSRADPAARELRNRGLSLLDRLTPIKRWLTARALDALKAPTMRKLAHLFRPILALGLAFTLCHAAVAQEAVIRKNIAERLPDFPKIDEVTKTAIPGLYELRMGTEVLYTDERGDTLIEGQLIDTKTRSNITEARLNKLTAIDFASLPLKDAIVWKQGSGTRKLVVFADPNCGYCKRFEKELQQVKDVTVYTFLYPILGGDSPEKSKNIWCSKDNTNAWREWMLNGAAPIRSMGQCDTTAIDRNVAMAKKYRVNGTPAIVFEDGKRVPGAMTLDQVEKQFALSRAKG